MSPFIFSIAAFNRCRRVRLASYTLAAWVWVSVTSIGPSLPERASFPTLLLGAPKRGCTRAAILRSNSRTAASIFLGALTTRSRFEGFALSWERLNRHLGYV